MQSLFLVILTTVNFSKIKITLLSELSVIVKDKLRAKISYFFNTKVYQEKQVLGTYNLIRRFKIWQAKLYHIFLILFLKFSSYFIKLQINLIISLSCKNLSYINISFTYYNPFFVNYYIIVIF